MHNVRDLSRGEGEENERCLTVVGETLLEFLAGEEDAALDGAKREIHLLGYLVVLVSGNMHREGDAVVVRKRVDGVCYL